MLQFRRSLYAALALFVLSFSWCHAQSLESRLLFFEGFNDPAVAAVGLNVAGVTTSLGPVSNSGENSFVVGNDRAGAGEWQTVPSQFDITGNIDNPDEGFVYVRSLRAISSAGVENANFNPRANSDRFITIGRGAPITVCTMGMENVYMSFYWLGQGDLNNAQGSTAYAELYWSVATFNGSRTWQPFIDPNTGERLLLNANNQWEYLQNLTMPEWIDQTTLSFGFRWTNRNTNENQVLAANNNMMPFSFALDQLAIIAEYDPNKVVKNDLIMSGVTINQDICKRFSLGQFNIRFEKPTCDCNVTIQLSNENGGFDFGTTEINTSPIGQNVWQGGIDYGIPEGFTEIPRGVPDKLIANGGCYYVRAIRRCNLPPFETVSEPIGCIGIKLCSPKVQVTYKPPSTNDDNRDTVCVLSVFDVPFNTEIGRRLWFENDNNFLCEISDVDGQWFNPPVYLPGGLFNDARTYHIRPQPGLISSYIPDRWTDASGNDKGRVKESVIAGVTGRDSCRYRIRVVSTNPRSEGSDWGPFCIRYCDIETNSNDEPDPSTETGQTPRDIGRQLSIRACVTDLVGADIEVEYDINEWIKLQGLIENAFDPTDYLDPNNFYFEIWKGNILNGELRFLNRGEVGQIETTEGGKIKLTLPPLDGLYGLSLIPPGLIYIRIVADNGQVTKPGQTYKLDEFFSEMPGTLVRLNLGYPFEENELFLLDSRNGGYCATEPVFIDYAVTRFQHEKGSSYHVFGIFTDEDGLSDVDINQRRTDIRTGYQQGLPILELLNYYDFSFFRTPARGQFTQGAVYDFRPDPVLPAIRGGRDRIGFWVPEDVRPWADKLYIFTMEENGGCYSKVSEPFVIPIVRQPIPPVAATKICVGDVAQVGFIDRDLGGGIIIPGFTPETYYDVRLVTSTDGSDISLPEGANTYEMVEDAANLISVKFNKAGFYSLKTLALNKCAGINTYVTVEVVPKPETTFPEDTTVCLGESITINARYDNSRPADLIEYSLIRNTAQLDANGDPVRDNDGKILYTAVDETIESGILTELNPYTFTPTVPMRITFKLQDAEYQNCQLDKEMNIFVGEFEIDIETPPTICEGEIINLNASNANDYQWAFDASIVGNTNAQSVMVQPTQTTTYSLTANGFIDPNTTCQDTTSIRVPVLKKIGKDENLFICNSQRLTLDAGNPTGEYTWTYQKDVSATPNELGQTQKIRARTPGIYTVEVRVPGRQIACFKKEFNINELTTAQIQTDILDCYNPNIILDSKAPNGFVLWSTGETTPTIVVKEPGRYTVDIYDENNDFCARVTYLVKLGEECLKFHIEVPNAFTPNKDAGQYNEQWRVWLHNVRKYECRIYDRWGNMVYEDTREQQNFTTSPDREQGGIEFPSILWDGVINGEPGKEGAYVYVIEAESITDEKVKLVGTVTLLF